MRGPGNAREVTFHRVVNIVERRSPIPLTGGDFDRRGHEDQYNGPMCYQDPRECQGNGQGNYLQDEMEYFENEDPRFRISQRNSPLFRNEGQYSHYSHNRDDLRHHLDTRNNGRGGKYFRNGGRDPGPLMREDHVYRRRGPFRERSPLRRSSQASSSDSKPANKSHSNQQKPKTTAPASPPPVSPKEEPPQITTKESPPASVAESEEVVAASVEPEPSPEEDLKARRLEAIKAKALEIETDYRQDCETFRTVVKMLVEKEPSLDYLLQAPLEKNLEEIKDRCLNSLTQFIKELDEVIVQPSTAEPATEGKT